MPSSRRAGGRTRIVIRHQPLWTRSDAFTRRLRAFEQRNPGVEVVSRLVPNSSDVLHQFYLTALEGSADEFDVFVADVIWIPEFARAGWIADLSPWFSPDDVRTAFVAPAADTVVFENKTFALPWYLDVGLLYARRDLVGDAPIARIDAMRETIRRLRAREATMQGLLFQGRQSEGLVCIGHEAMWAFGASTDATPPGARVRIDSPAARAGLGWLREMVESGDAPRAVLSAGEEDSRRAFQAGHAVFMRNWPYAWSVLQSAGSPVRDRVVVMPLPTHDGTPGHGALGGWQLVMNARIDPSRREAAVALIRDLTSLDAGVDLALGYGRLPPQRAAYRDERLIRGAPFLAQLAPHIERARPRPVTPYYNLFDDTLQSEFSAVVTGVRTPEEALTRAQRSVDRWASST